MALGDSYISAADLREYSQITNPYDDVLLLTVGKAVSRRIEQHCNRQFNDAGSATARVFTPMGNRIETDEFHTSSGLIVQVDRGDDGTYEETVTSGYYRLEPVNGVVDGQTGWPYRRIVMRSTYYGLPCGPSVQVTARWGWSAVPDIVTEAVKIQCLAVLDARNSPGGEMGTGDYVATVRSKQLDPRVRMLLEPYVRYKATVA